MSLFPSIVEQLQELRKNWVADAGKEVEKELLSKWAEGPGLTDEDRVLIREWIDGGYKRIAGSERQRRFLKRWINQEPLTDRDRESIREWIDKPDSQKKRDELFWEAAKKSVIGRPDYEIAMERHARLSPRARIVAWAIARGLRRKEIRPLIGKELRTVADCIAEIKEQMAEDNASMTLVHIARWFLGR